MVEKAKVCGPDYGKCVTPAENYLSVSHFTYGPHCQRGRGAL